MEKFPFPVENGLREYEGDLATFGEQKLWNYKDKFFEKYQQIMLALEKLGYKNAWDPALNQKANKECYVSWNASLWPGLEICIEGNRLRIHFPEDASCKRQKDAVQLTVHWGLPRDEKFGPLIKNLEANLKEVTKRDIKLIEDLGYSDG